MALKHVKLYPTSFKIGKIQMKISLGYFFFFNLLDWQKLKAVITHSVGETWETSAVVLMCLSAMQIILN